MPGLGFGPTELILILVIVVIIFGVGKLPQVGGAIGQSIREFRKAANDDDTKTKTTTSTTTTPPTHEG